MNRCDRLLSFERISGPIDQRLANALAKIALAARHELRQIAAIRGLSAVQAQVLIHLSHEGPQEMCPLASRLALTPATVSDSVAALEQHHFVRRRPVPEDRRRIRVAATTKGKRIGRSLSLWPEFFQDGIAQFSQAEKQVFFRFLTRVILSLLEKGVIQKARMCVTCAHFQPCVRNDKNLPHHCALVDVPLGPATMRLDCLEHERAAATPAALMDKLNAWL